MSAGMKDAKDILKARGPEALLALVNSAVPFVADDRDLTLARSACCESDMQVAELATVKQVFPMPGGKIGHEQAGEITFPVIGRSKRVFMRGGIVHEIEKEDAGKLALVPVTADRFVALVETFPPWRVAKYEEAEDESGKVTVRWRSCTFTRGAAQTAIVTDAARKHLPRIEQIVSCPIITFGSTPGTCRVLTTGYHEHQGGTFIAGGKEPPEVPLEKAQSALADLLADFDFASQADASRAVASLLSPALKMGGLIDDHFPLDLAEADQSQSGKTYRQKLAVKIYNGEAEAILQNKGGVGSLDEAVSAALIKGRPFIMLDNVRGRVDSEILESAIRGHGSVSCRTLRHRATINTGPFLWYLSTNGAELTRDLANRAVVTRIRKRPAGFIYREFSEGDLVRHIEANQSFYLGAVFSIVREWVKQGRPRTTETRHDFRLWTQSMDWIIQEIFGLPPLMEGHREEQVRTANPAMQWLREIVLAAVADGRVDGGIDTYMLLEIASGAGIDLPGRPTNDSPECRAGKLLGQLFRDAGGDELAVDGYRFTRSIEEHVRENRQVIEKKLYTISR